MGAKASHWLGRRWVQQVVRCSCPELNLPRAPFIGVVVPGIQGVLPWSCPALLPARGLAVLTVCPTNEPAS